MCRFRWLTLILCCGVYFFFQPLLAQEIEKKRPKIGLVLSGGAAKGIAHIGVLKVLEEAGIHVDMVAGTSMGSIVGGLYAMGYSADSIEKIALSQNWGVLLGDEISRNNYSIEEKEDQDRYMVTFPVKDLRPKLPSGLKSGQNISMLLSRLAWPVHQITDFDSLPRPFLCVAADITTGKEVVLHQGYLPEAIKASMAIPTVFAPVELDGHLLVDGGIVNNFPADHLKEMGADIIIGVNLGFRPYSEKELHSLANILEQSIFLRASEKNKQNISSVNILIEPDVYKNFNVASFNDAKSLIAVGEEAARKVLPQLKKLADSLASYPLPAPCSLPHANDSMWVKKIEIKGLHNVSRQFVLRKMNLEIPGIITVEDLQEAIDRVYGSQFFEKILYHPVEEYDGTVLIINAEEKDYDLLRIAGRYDSDYKASLLINTTFKNYLIKGSKLSFDFILGEFTRFKMNYTIHSALRTPTVENWINAPWKLALLPDFSLTADYNNFEFFKYTNGIQSVVYNFSQARFELKSTNNITNSTSLSIGASFDLSSIKAKIGSIESQSPSYSYFLNMHSTLKIDTRDNFAFPTRGFNLLVRAELLEDIGNRSDHLAETPRVLFRYASALSLGKKFALIPKIMAGHVFRDTIAPDYMLYCGGNLYSPVNDGVFPFSGLRRFECQGTTAAVAALNLRYQFITHHYVSIVLNVGESDYSLESIINPDNYFKGAGISYGYDSMIGPLELSIMGSDVHKGVLAYFNLGFWF